MSTEETVRLPDGLQHFFKVVLGVEWPEGSEAGLSALSLAWKSYGHEISAVLHEIELLSREVENSLGSRTGEAAAGSLNGEVVAGLEELVSTSAELAVLAKNAAADIRKSKIMLVVMAALTLATVIQLIASLFGAFLVPVVEAAARLSLRAILAQLLARLGTLTVRQVAGAAGRLAFTTAKWAAAGAAFAGGLDGAIQVGQIAAGERDGFDLNSFRGSLLSGAIGGAAGGVFHSAARGLGRSLTKEVRGSLPRAWQRGVNVALPAAYALGQAGMAVVSTPLVNLATHGHGSLWEGILGGLSGRAGGRSATTAHRATPPALSIPDGFARADVPAASSGVRQFLGGEVDRPASTTSRDRLDEFQRAEVAGELARRLKRPVSRQEVEDVHRRYLDHRTTTPVARNARDLAFDVVSVGLSGRRTGLRGGAVGGELELDIGVSGRRLSVSGPGIDLVADQWKNPVTGKTQNVFELVTKPAGVLRGEQARFSEQQVLNSAAAAVSRLRDAAPGSRVDEVFQQKDGYHVAEGGDLTVQRTQHAQQIDLQLTVGVSVYGLRDLFDEIGRSPEVAAVPPGDFVKQAFAGAREFGRSVSEEFRGTRPVAGELPRNAHESEAKAVEGYATLVYTQLASATIGLAPSTGINLVKSNLFALSRPPMGAIQEALPTAARNFLRKHADQLVAEVEARLRQDHPQLVREVEERLRARPGGVPSGFLDSPMLLQKDGTQQSHYRDWLRDAWAPDPENRRAFRQTNLVGTMKWSPVELDDAGGARSELPLVPIELRFFGTAHGRTSMVQVAESFSRWADVSREIDERAWASMAASRAAETGGTAPALPAPVARGGVPGVPHHVDPVGVAFHEHRTSEADIGANQRGELSMFADDAVEAAARLNELGASGMRVRVEGGGNGAVFGRGRADTTGQRRADAVAAWLGRELHGTQDRVGRDFAVDIAATSRASGPGVSPGWRPESSADRREVRVWIEPVGLPDAVDRPSPAGQPDHFGAESAVIAPFVQARLAEARGAAGLAPAGWLGGDEVAHELDRLRSGGHDSGHDVVAEVLDRIVALDLVASRAGDASRSGKAPRRDPPPEEPDESMLASLGNALRERGERATEMTTRSVYDIYRRRWHAGLPVPPGHHDHAAQIVSLARDGALPATRPGAAGSRGTA